MRASIVVPHYGDRDLTLACLASVRDTCDAEVVVVDNGTGDDLRSWRAAVRNDVNRGFAVACNQGSAVAEGDPVVFLNNDTVCRPRWLEPLLAAFDDGKVGIAGSRLLYPDGRVQHAGVRLYEAHGVLTAENVRQDGPTREVEAVTGACMAVRREAFCGFDEGYRNGYEDVDLCLTVREQGWKVVYVASSTVVHHESASGPERWRCVRENVARLQEKWGERWRSIPATPP